MFWIFIFIVFCITAFLMVTSRESKSQVKNVQKKLNNVELRNVESTNVTIQDWYKTLMVDLKNDLTKTVEEVKALQDEVASLSRKREDLKHDILKQQESYQEMLADFSKELDGKDGALQTNPDRSRRNSQNLLGTAVPWTTSRFPRNNSLSDRMH